MPISVTETFDSQTTIGQASGTTFVATPGGYGMSFSQTTESRLVYPYASGFPRVGTLELTVNVDNGYFYSANVGPQTSETRALLFSTDIQGGDVTWPGSAWLYGYADGTIRLHVAGVGGVDGWAPQYHLVVSGTNFRFDQWHTIGISYGTQGLAIALDGVQIGTLASNTQELAGGGTHSQSLGQPTIGESVPSFWSNNSYEGGFNGVVEAVRYSDTQFDWALHGASMPTLSIGDATTSEGGNLVFLVTLNGVAGPAGVTANIQVDGVSATEGQDFAGASYAPVTFAAGETGTRQITIATLTDIANEPAETITVSLTNVSGATLTDGVATGTIINSFAQLPTTAEIFAEHGEIGFLALLANAAYHLEDAEQSVGGQIIADIPLEIITTDLNEERPSRSGDRSYELAGTQLHWLTSADLPALAPISAVGRSEFFPNIGLQDGIFVNANAALLVGRSEDALFLAFRGTNDNSGGNWSPIDALNNPPDVEDWDPIDQANHYGWFAPAFDAIRDYLLTGAGQDIPTVYVTGHSLGAAMAQRYMEAHPDGAISGVTFEAVNFASPGAGLGAGTDNRITQFWHEHDPILIGTALSDQKGDENVLFPEIHFLQSGIEQTVIQSWIDPSWWPGSSYGELHTADYYTGLGKFLHENNIGLSQLGDSVVFGGHNYGRVWYDVIVDEGSFPFNTDLSHLDIIRFGSGNDQVSDLDELIFSSDDVLIGGAGDDTLRAYDGDDLLAGGIGNDTADYGFAATALNVVLGATGSASGSEIDSDTLTDMENVIGGAGADQFTGDASANIFDPGAGNDIVLGGGGLDTVRYIDATTRVTVNLVTGTATGTQIGLDTLSSVENATGGTYSDIIMGTEFANVLDGGGYRDILNGLGGDDTYYVDNSGDRPVEVVGGGIDTVIATRAYTLAASTEIEVLSAITGNSYITLAGNGYGQTLNGSDGVNRLYGMVGADALNGAGNNDYLSGGNGVDTLTGGAGLDSFVFDFAPNRTTNVDTITDYNVADDRFLLDDAAFAGIGAIGALGAARFKLGTAATDADDRIIYDAATGKVYFDANGNVAGGQIHFATVAIGTALTAGEFLVF